MITPIEQADDASGSENRIYPPAVDLRPTIVHLTASPSYGGVERQMLELAKELAGDYQSAFISFREEERCWDFIDQAHCQGFQAFALDADFPNIPSTVRELTGLLRTLNTRILLPHGYKSNLLGYWVSKRLGLPIVSISHGWTGESLAVKLYERLDKMILRRVDRVVCVSDGQAAKVRHHVPTGRVQTICDAVRTDRFNNPDPPYRTKLENLFPKKPNVIVGAAGRLSPEKGYRFFVEAAAEVVKQHPKTGFVLFGDGPLHNDLASRIKKLGLADRFLLPGFTRELDKFYHHFDLFVLPSFTEGLPNVVLESFAARVPVVATAVGGTPEAVEDGVNGYLVPPGQAKPLAQRISQLIADPDSRRKMGIAGRQRVETEFSFAHQAEKYNELLASYIPDMSTNQHSSGFSTASLAVEDEFQNNV